MKHDFKVISETPKMKSMSSKRAQSARNYKDCAPYEFAITILKSLKTNKVPFEQMILLASISTEITDSVNNFWKEMNHIVSSTLLNIDADELMTIFIYILIKSQMADILVYSKLISLLTTCTSRSTMIGYYYTTLEASLIYILEIKDRNDFLQKDRRITIIRNSRLGGDINTSNTINTVNTGNTGNTVNNSETIHNLSNN
jgi:hypothetical protein